MPVTREYPPLARQLSWNPKEKGMSPSTRKRLPGFQLAAHTYKSLKPVLPTFHVKPEEL